MDQRTLFRIRELCAPDAPAMNLVRACLLLSRESYSRLRAEHYINRLERSIDTLSRRLPPSAPGARRLQALNIHFFEQAGYRGNTEDYHDPRNSHLNEVMDRRTGLPITLSLLYMALGQGVHLPLRGISFPGHFLVALEGAGEPVYLDPFRQGQPVSRRELEQRLDNLGGETARLALSEFLHPAEPMEIILRILRNLKGAHLQRNEPLAAIRALDLLLALAPGLGPEFKTRGLLYARLQCPAAAIADLETYLDLEPQASDADSIMTYVEELRRDRGKLH